MISMIKTYYRKITESLPKRSVFVYALNHYLLLFLATLFVLSSVLVAVSYVALVDAQSARKEVLESFYYWKKVSDKHPNSPDAHFEAGYYALRLGDRKTAAKFLGEALRLDPSFEKAKLLSQQLIVN